MSNHPYPYSIGSIFPLTSEDIQPINRLVSEIEMLRQEIKELKDALIPISSSTIITGERVKQVYDMLQRGKQK